MITFHTIRWKNFLSAGNTFTEIELDAAKNTLIMGHNGSGKSTFLDALTFALFGKPFRKVNKGNVINSINGKHCVVEIEFTTSNKKYKVIRGVKPTIFEIWCEDKKLNQDAASRDFQEFLELHILKMNFKSFTQVVILGSASFTPFMQLSALDRRTVIEDLLDIQIFSAMSSIVKTRLQANKDFLEANRIVTTSKEENKTYIEKTLKSLRAQSEEKLNEMKGIRDNLITKIAELETEIDDLSRERDDLIASVADISKIKERHMKLVELKSKFKTNEDRLNKETNFYHDYDNCPTCKQAIETSFKEEKINHNVSKVVQLQEALNKIEGEIDDILNSLNQADETLGRLDETRLQISSHNASVDGLKNSLVAINAKIDGHSQSDTTTRESEEQLKTVEHDLSTLKKEKETLLDERTLIDTATTLLKDGGIKTKIIKQYLPIINKHINSYLAKMGFFVNFNINENFEETIKSRYRDEFSYNNFSEGEKLRIDLAILLTWRQIAKMKNSVNVNILIFDEILDRAMDTQGTDEFIKIMWDMDKSTSVFVISHKDAMVDKFQRILKFEKIKNFSTMKKED